MFLPVNLPAILPLALVGGKIEKKDFSPSFLRAFVVKLTVPVWFGFWVSGFGFWDSFIGPMQID